MNPTPEKPSGAGGGGWVRLAVGIVLVLTFAFLILQDILGTPGATPAASSANQLVPAVGASAVGHALSLSVARYPGLVQTHWVRDGREVTVRYQGAAEFDAVLAHYAKGFADMGYSTTVLPDDSPRLIRHEFRRGDDVVRFSLQRLANNDVRVRLVTRLS